MRLPYKSFIYKLISNVLYLILYVAAFFALPFVYSLRFVNKKEFLSFTKQYKKAILVSNHSLYLDPGIVARGCFPKSVFFSGMNKTFQVPFLGTFLWYLRSFPVSTHKPFELMKNIKNGFDAGGYVHLFPEGNLIHKNKQLQPFKKGAFVLSAMFDCPIVPVVLSYNERKRKIGFPVKTVTVIFGKPFFPKEFGLTEKETKNGQKMADTVREYIQEILNESERKNGEKRNGTVE